MSVSSSSSSSSSSHPSSSSSALSKPKSSSSPSASPSPPPPSLPPPPPSLSSLLSHCRVDSTRLLTSTKYFSSARRRDFYGHSRSIRSLSFSPTGTKLCSVSSDGLGKIWTIENLKSPVIDHHNSHYIPNLEMRGHTEGIEQMAWNSNKMEEVATASIDKTVRIWDCRAATITSHPQSSSASALSSSSSSSVKCVETILCPGENISVMYSPDGQCLAVGNKKNQLSLIDCRMNKIVKTFSANYEINEFAFAKSSDHIIITTGKGSVEVWKTSTLSKLLSLDSHIGPLYSIKVDPSYKYFAVGGADSMVSLYDMAELICIRNFPRMESPIRGLSFSYDSLFLAIAAEDNKIDISLVSNTNNVYTIETGGGDVSCIAWSTKEHLLAYAVDDGGKGMGVGGGGAGSGANICVWGMQGGGRDKEKEISKPPHAQSSPSSSSISPLTSSSSSSSSSSLPSSYVPSPGGTIRMGGITTIGASGVPFISMNNQNNINPNHLHSSSSSSSLSLSSLSNARGSGSGGGGMLHIGNNQNHQNQNTQNNAQNNLNSHHDVNMNSNPINSNSNSHLSIGMGGHQRGMGGGGGGGGRRR